jgi:hypothetical protein
MASTIIDAFMNPIWNYIKDDINSKELLDNIKSGNDNFDMTIYSFKTSIRKKDYDENHKPGDHRDFCAWSSNMSLMDSIKYMILFVDNINENDDTKMCIIRFSSLILSYLIPFFNSANKEDKEIYKKIGYLYNLFGQFPNNNEKSTKQALYFIDTTTIVRSLFIYIKTYWNDHTKNFVNRACAYYKIKRIKVQSKKSFIDTKPIAFNTSFKEYVTDVEKEAIYAEKNKEIKIIDTEEFPELNENVVIKINKSKKNCNVFDNSSSSYSSILQIKPDIPEEEEEEPPKEPHDDWQKLTR